MTWFRPKSALEFEGKQWPEIGLAGLSRFVGGDRVILAKDGTVYVVVASGHPQRLELGWWVIREANGDVRVAAGDFRPDWDEIEAPQ